MQNSKLRIHSKLDRNQSKLTVWTASPNSSSSFSASKATATVIVVPDHASSTPASASHNGAATASGERKMMTNLTKRPPALLQYTDLVYTVREKSGKFGSSWFATKTILKGKRFLILRWLKFVLDRKITLYILSNFRCQWESSARRIDCNHGTLWRREKYFDEYFGWVQNIKCHWWHHS